MPSTREKHFVFLTGGTGFIGRPLISALLARGHRVRALVRPGSEKKLPPGCELVAGDAASVASIKQYIGAADTFVQLVGVTHPNPSKDEQFRSVDLAAGCAGLDAARSAGVNHFIYLSVAQPAPMMHSYIAVRAEVEERIRGSGMNATIVRPWYVLGPGRRWPILLKPVYALMELIPSTRNSAERLGLVTDRQMNAALVSAIEHPIFGVRLLEVPQIREAAL